MNYNNEKIKFQIALGAVKHFGKNLYTTNPPAIAELIANAWDAYARKCQIIVNDDCSMYIIDNGIGMTDIELKERYAKSGFEKNEDIRIPHDMLKRPYMGKKGIGKFSAFSLSEEYTIYTKSLEDDKWKKLTLKYHELYSEQTEFDAELKRIDDPSVELIQTLLPYDIPDKQGTIIVLHNLTRKINKTTTKSLMDLIAKRFSTDIFNGKYDFELLLNYEEINPVVLREHFFYAKIEFVYYFGMDLVRLKKMFPNVDKKNFVNKNNDYFKTHASGWIGTVNKPTDLRTEDQTSVSGVSIYINGKIADENIFKHSVDGRVPNAYLIGEVDLFDWDSAEDSDPVLSSREGLNHELQGIKKLKEELSKVRNELLEKWNEMRSSRPLTKHEYIQKVLKDPKNKEVFEKLEPQTQGRALKYAQKVFDKPKEDGTSEQDKIVDLLFSAIIQISTDEEMRDALETNYINNDELIEHIVKIFKLNEISHALRLRDSVNNKLEAINLLEKHIENEEIEAAFERVLADNPWLINPTWEIKKSIQTQTWLELVNLNNEKKDRVRTDIIIEVSDENYPIIIELKRDKYTNYSSPDAKEVVNQIYDYRTAIAERLTLDSNDNSTVQSSDIKAYFICGEKAMKKLKGHINSYKHIENNDIVLITYDSIVKRAKQLLNVMFPEDIEDKKEK